MCCIEIHLKLCVYYGKIERGQLNYVFTPLKKYYRTLTTFTKKKTKKHLKGSVCKVLLTTFKAL